MGKQKRFLGTAEIVEGRKANLSGAVGLAGKRKAKFNNVPTVKMGLVFDSEGEAERYKELWFMQNCGAIRNLEHHPVYDLHALGGDKITTYEADSRYEEPDGKGGWIPVVEDFKGCMTRRAQMIKKWMKAEYGISIRYTRKKKAPSRRRK